MKIFTDKKYVKNIEEHLTNAFKLFFEQAEKDKMKNCCSGNKLCTAYQAAHCFNIPESTLYDWMNQGKLHYIRVDKVKHIKIKNLKKLISPK